VTKASVECLKKRQPMPCRENEIAAHQRIVKAISRIGGPKWETAGSTEPAV
jgi:hypothetical protein